MQRDQDDRPSVKELLSLTSLREQAKKLKINLGAAGRFKASTVQEIIESKRIRKEESQKKAQNEK